MNYGASHENVFSNMYVQAYQLVRATSPMSKNRGGGGMAGPRVINQGASPSNCPCSPDHPGDPDQQARADEPSDQVTHPSRKIDPNHAQNSVSNRCPDHAKHNIPQQPHATLHELPC